MTGWALLPTLSLRLRIALTILCLEAALVGGVLFVTLHHSLNTTKIELAAADRDTTALLHDLGRIALLTDEFGAVQSFIEQLGQASRIKRPSPSSTCLVGSWRRAMPQPSAQGRSTYADPNTELDQLSPIGTGGYRLGWLHVHFSNDGLVQAYGRATRLGLTIAIAGMLVIALVGWWIGHLLTRKLARLAAVADSVSGGDLSLRAQISGRDEVARVGRAFDGMVDRLERRLETIRLDRDRLILPTEAINEGFVSVGSAGAAGPVQSTLPRAARQRGPTRDPARHERTKRFLDWPVAPRASPTTATTGASAWPACWQRHRRGGGLMEVRPA